MTNRVWKVLALTLVVPFIGLVVSTLILMSWDSEVASRGIPSLSYVCAHLDEFQGGESACAERIPINLLRNLSLLGGAIPLLLISLQAALAAWAGTRRAALAAVFPFLTGVTILAMVVMVVVQAVVAIASLWYGETHLIGRIHVGIILTLAGGAAFAAIALLRAVLAMSRKPSIHAFGVSLTPAKAPNLFARVGDLAQRLGAPPPRNIVVGLSPTFYVTHAHVHVHGSPEPLQGETLFLSAPLARLLTQDELDGVIGHELGHFRGQDTLYSLKFAPVYAGLGGAIHGMVNRQGKVAWAAYPALEMLGFLHNLFAAKESTVGRARELEADQAGAECASPEALSRALLKISLHSKAWEQALGTSAFMFDESRGALNYSVGLSESVRQSFDQERWRVGLESVLETVMPHPIDTHPPVRQRLAALGFDLDGLDVESLTPPKDEASGARAIDDLDALELRLSQMEFALREQYSLLPEAPPSQPSAMEPRATASEPA